MHQYMSHHTSLESLFEPHFIILYTIYTILYCKKFRTKVQVKDIKLRFVKNLFFTFKSKYLCCVSQDNIIKNMRLQKGKISCG